ncbi:hypothetical protein GDO81_021699 [Engystomops pustulosus]|uniref:Taste receptor type 2 n=1 Tax=Engystomops pustulosus TaxID=76066 RepID=A0AAV6Z6T4_ENGPU|nr:hypothetical protein GDO81_021699 [Engystomops pustulosus]
MALNSHILLVYIGILRNGLPLRVSEKVHIIKALLNISQLFIIITQTIIYAFWSDLFFVNESFHWMMMVNMVLTAYSYWLMAFLCVYYCTNITNLGHQTLVWLRNTLSSYQHLILIGSGFGSVAISFPVFWYSSIIPATNTTYQSIEIQGISQNIIYKTIIYILSCFLPFTIAFISTIISSWSLINHMWTMRQNNKGFTRSKFQTQLNATRTMILFLVTCVIYNVIQMFFFTITSIYRVTVILMWLVIILYPISEATIIIQSSSKLRKTLPGEICGRKRRSVETKT